MKLRSGGFTLLEILLAITIVGVIAVLSVGISNSIKNLGKTSETKNRLELTAARAREYYRAREALPAPAGSYQLPIAANALNLEQKYRLDAWGQFIHYNYNSVSGDLDIDGLTVHERAVAGVVVSAGPDQTFNSFNPASPSGTYPDISGGYAGEDDIIIPIDVNSQAQELALEELTVLQNKVKAFDAIYEGIDNDGDGPIDEDGCSADDATCPPNQAGRTVDPNCGTAALDNIKNNAVSYSGCPFYDATSSDLARDFIWYFNSLADSFRIDPWLTGYIWGDGINATSGTSDPRYHKFFSAGPDASTNQDPTHADSLDDIIP